MKNQDIHVYATPVNVENVEAIHAEVLPDSTSTINEAAAYAYLLSQNFPVGLIKAFNEGLKKRPFRFFILDDSGSMNTNGTFHLLTHLLPQSITQLLTHSLTQMENCWLKIAK